jgi:hypothetical protein
MSIPHGINFLFDRSCEKRNRSALREKLSSPEGYDDMVGRGFTDLRDRLFGGLYHPLDLGLRHPYPRKMHRLLL